MDTILFCRSLEIPFQQKEVAYSGYLQKRVRKFPENEVENYRLWQDHEGF